MSKVLEEIQKIRAINKKTIEKASLLKQLQAASKVEISGNGIIELDKGVIFETIYANGATVTIAKYPKMGSKTPRHCHDGIIEYLICIKGSVSVSFEHGYRILNVKDCASIPEDTKHIVTALEDDSAILAICVPSEELYKSSMDMTKCSCV